MSSLKSVLVFSSPLLRAAGYPPISCPHLRTRVELLSKTDPLTLIWSAPITDVHPFLIAETVVSYGAIISLSKKKYNKQHKAMQVSIDKDI